MIVASLIALSALAFHDTLMVVWEAPPGCPDSAAVMRRFVDEGLAATPAPVELRAVVSRESDGYSLRGELRSMKLSQAFELPYGQTCGALLDDLALYLALLFDEPKAPEAPPVERYLRAMVSGERGTLRWCSATGCDEVAVLPGVILAGGWRHGGLRVEIGAPLYTRDTFAPESGRFGDLAIRWYLTGAHLRLCGGLERRAFELMACGEVGLRLLIGDPSKPSGFRRDVPVLPWAVVGLGLAAVWWVHERVGLRIEVAPGIDIRRLEYRASDKTEGTTPEVRPHVEVGGFHLAVGSGFEFRLGSRVGRNRR